MQLSTLTSLAALAAVVALAGPVLPGSSRGTSQAEGRILREEFFVVEALPDDLDPRREGELERPHYEAREVGLVAFRRRNDADGRMLEWDVRFPDDETRVLHVERESAAGPSLVWREWQADRGRTLTLEPLPAEEGGGARLLEWGREEPVRSELESGFVLRLGLLEHLRQGELRTGTFWVFDPLAREVEELRLRTLELEPRIRPAVAQQPAEGPERRVVELVGADGRLRGAYVFEGSDLVGFQWQSGHLRARRIDAADYVRRMAAAGAAVEVVEEH